MADAPRASRKEQLVRSTLHGLSAQYAAVIIQGVLQLVVLAILARLLSPADYGVVGAAAAVVAFATVFSQFGLAVALIRHPTLTERTVRAGYTLSIALSVAMSVLLAVRSTSPIRPSTSASTGWGRPQGQAFATSRPRSPTR